MKIESLQVGLPKYIGEAGAANPMDREWQSGIFKEPTSSIVACSVTGLAGDGQADLVNHGGPDKAINVYPVEHLPYWEKALGLSLSPGSFGENFTTSGMTEETTCIGDVYKVGEIVVQISQPRQPCWKLARRWRIKDLPLQVHGVVFSGYQRRTRSSRGCYGLGGTSVSGVDRRKGESSKVSSQGGCCFIYKFSVLPSRFELGHVCEEYR